MTKIRIGNDITLRITVTRKSVAETLTGKTLTLLLRSPYARIELTPTIQDNVLTAQWLGTEQTKTGTYTVTLIEDYGEGNRNTVDSVGVFTLVSNSTDENEALTGDQIIDLDLDISVPANGLSAYEIALAHGYEGTEEEWLASLSAASEAAAKTATEAAESATTAAEAANAAAAKVDTAVEAANTALEEANTALETTATYAAAELARVEAENARVEAEAARVKAEEARVAAETTREKAETARATSETDRKDSETARAEAETKRVTAENARVEAETARANAEKERATAEANRESASSTAVSNAEAATAAANAAATKAEEAAATLAVMTNDEIDAACPYD